MKFMRPGLTGLALCLALLSACGNDPQAGENRDYAASAKTWAQGIFHLGHRSDAAGEDPATVRATLAQAGVPVLGLTLDKVHFTTYLSPYGENGPVVTWASGTYESVSVVDGIVVATRGLGPDIMSSVAPGLGQVRSGTGFFHRVYYYLDGADQTQRVDFDCTFAPAGAETITLLGLAYATHRVTESCTNPESSFENAYWFDSSGSLRQSLQFVSELAGSIQLQRLID